AAIIGREFDRDLLVELSVNNETTVDAVLERLLEEGILEMARKASSDQSRYRFSHALIHEAAYSSQLRRKRRRSHLAVTQALEAKGESNHQLLAHHFELAGRPNEAMQNWRTAALYSLMQSHNAEAIALYDRALQLLEQISAAERDRVFEVHILIEQGLAYIAQMGFAAPQVQRVYDRAEKIGRALGPSLDMMRALWGTWLYYLVSGNLKRARSLAEEMFELANTLGSDNLKVEALWALGDTEFWMADIALAEQHLNLAIELYDKLGADSFKDHLLLFGQDPKVAALCYVGYLKWTTGHLVESRAASVASMRHAEIVDHPFTRGWAYCFGVNSFWWRNEYRAAIRFGPRFINYSDEQDFRLWSPATQIGYGASLASVARCQADLTTASTIATEGLKGYVATGALTVVPTAALQIADSWIKAGDLEQARHWVDYSQNTAKKTGERISLLRSQVYRARLMRAAGETDARTEKLLKKAIKEARACGATMIAFENAMELSELLEQSGRASEASKLLGAALDALPEPLNHKSLRQAARKLEVIGAATA
ncbi:MAG: hypothetical protein OER56_17535, partial [Hyphomicrobiales bacterium]|nr:hypothetical protein [Hyphomicrobiales bacterium]